jgi:hypothetical protein
VEGVEAEDMLLQGRRLRLEPLAFGRIDGLVAAAAAAPSLYQWSPVPQGKAEVASYIEEKLRERGTRPDAGWPCHRLHALL